MRCLRAVRATSSRARTRALRAVRLLLPALLAASVVPGAASASYATASPTSLPVAGVYSGPGVRTSGAASAFAAWSGMRVGGLLDFPPESSWTGSTGLTGPAWLLEAYRGRPERLEYSLPMLPAVAGTSLAACGTGAYDTYWAQTGRNLVAYGQQDAIVRPGWEMNASWYRWSATGRTADYIRCFRRIVTTMRATPGASFAFDWNVNVGSAPFRGELAYPGDAYVDYVGVDVYDTSWSWYPTPAGSTRPASALPSWLLRCALHAWRGRRIAALFGCSSS